MQRHKIYIQFHFFISVMFFVNITRKTSRGWRVQAQAIFACSHPCRCFRACVYALGETFPTHRHFYDNVIPPSSTADYFSVVTQHRLACDVANLARKDKSSRRLIDDT